MTRSIFERAFSGLSFLLLTFLSVVLVTGADQLFGQLISRGFVPNSFSLSGILAPLLNLTHMGIYAAIGFGLANLAFRGTRAWRSGLAVGVPFLLQVATNGCILTIAQNWAWGMQGVPPIPNEFIFDAFVPLPAMATRLLILVVSLLYIAPAVILLARKVEMALARAGIRPVSAVEDRMPALTLSRE